MHEYSLRNDDTKPHEMTAPDLLREVVARLRWNYQRRDDDEGRERALALAAMLEEMATITPADADGWALITYFRLAGSMAPVNDSLEAFSERLARLAELYWFATAATGGGADDLEVYLDVAGALRISDVWIAYMTVAWSTSAASQDADKRYGEMLFALTYERVALVRCWRLSNPSHSHAADN